jgi:hypothetical protein
VQRHCAFLITFVDFYYFFQNKEVYSSEQLQMYEQASPNYYKSTGYAKMQNQTKKCSHFILPVDGWDWRWLGLAWLSGKDRWLVPKGYDADLK